MEDNKKYFHALQVKTQKCVACMKCVRVCPTAALRIRDGKVQMDEKRCIDCGRCISACKYGALVPWSDSLEITKAKKYKVAILSTAYAGQFSDKVSYATAIKAMYHLGFDEVLEESMITEYYGKMIKEYLKSHPQIRPVLSSNCPAVVRLIQVRFPSLLPNVLHLESPMSVLAMYYRQKLHLEKNIPDADIGIYQIVPCISQVTAVHQPEGNISDIENGAISIQEVFGEALQVLPEAAHDDRKIEIHTKGLSWSVSRMEAADLDDGRIKTLAVSGIPNVIEILLKIENQQIDPYDFIIFHSCTDGCVGGVLNVENPFIASSRIRHIISIEKDTKFEDDQIMELFQSGEFKVTPLEGRSIMKLSSDIKTALEKMKRIHQINATLPGLDCSACGSPTCITLAEDIVEGKATMEDCVVLLRKKVKNNRKKVIEV
ncbi:MAG: 4Fe-4S binding protein [Candidatus Cloacimonetes bacterium]|nr:4Fe-4S binding protein [Candidatus Cloacimonadota bacterium]